MKHGSSFRKTLKHIWGALSRGITAATVGITLVTTGLQAAVLTALDSARPVSLDTITDPLQLEAMASFWPLFARTAPLTIAFALLTVVSLPASKRRLEPFPSASSPRASLSIASLCEILMAVSFFVLIALGAATAVASWFGNLDVWGQPDLVPHPRGAGPFGIITGCINLLYKYYVAYGQRDFLSSVVLGVCLGWVVRRLPSGGTA